MSSLDEISKYMDEGDYKKAIEEYSNRNRRYGGL